MRPDLLPVVHPRLGYRVRLPDFPVPVHIIGFDSAWLAGDDNDNGKLQLTPEQVGRLTHRPDGRHLDGFRLALMHHPLTDLADSASCRKLLAEGVDLLLRGHVHESESNAWADPDSKLQELSAGCLYEHATYRSACQRIDIKLDDRGKVIDADIRLFAWSKNGFWHLDTGVYSVAKTDGRYHLRLTPAPESGANPSAGTADAQRTVSSAPEIGRAKTGPLVNNVALDTTTRRSNGTPPPAQNGSSPTQPTGVPQVSQPGPPPARRAAGGTLCLEPIPASSPLAQPSGPPVGGPVSHNYAPPQQAYGAPPGPPSSGSPGHFSPQQAYGAPHGRSNHPGSPAQPSGPPVAHGYASPQQGYGAPPGPPSSGSPGHLSPQQAYGAPHGRPSHPGSPAQPSGPPVAHGYASPQQGYGAPPGPPSSGSPGYFPLQQTYGAPHGPPGPARTSVLVVVAVVSAVLGIMLVLVLFGRSEGGEQACRVPVPETRTVEPPAGHDTGALRQSADIASEKIEEVNRGTLTTVMSAGRGTDQECWYRVRVRGSERVGWMHSVNVP